MDSEICEPTHGPRRKVWRSLRMTPAMAAALGELAAARGCSQSGLARQALALGLFGLLGGDPRDLPPGLVTK